MSNLELLSQTISEIAPLIRDKAISPVELVSAELEHIDSLHSSINSFITVLGDRALQRAKELEDALVHGDYKGALHGIPFAVKDNISTAGTRTTAGSKFLADFVPEEDALVVSKMHAGGGILLGKENLHEFALGPTSINPHYGAVHNPWDLDRIAGGSSGGSAANVASFQTFASLGTDAGGSVRIPASLCGVVGLKATLGRISLRGCLPTGNWPADHIGPITRSVRDCATVLQALAGYDDQDPSSVAVPVPDYAGGLDRDVKGMVVGVPSNHYFDLIDPEVATAVDRSIALLEKMGMKLKQIPIDGLKHLEVLRRMGAVEALVYHERFIRDRPSDYGEDVLSRLLSAQFIRAVDYAKAMRLRRRLREEFARAMREVDVLVCPTVPIKAFPIDAEAVTIKGARHPVTGPGVPSVLLTRTTSPSNLTGLPSITVPCGFTSEGLPVGLQLVGRPFEEEVILRVAHQYELTSARQTVIPPHVLERAS